MSGESILLTHAEVSAVVAGFASVVAALQRPLSPFQRHRFLTILLVALGSVMAALVPVWLSESGVAGQSLWRAASGIILVLGVAIGAINMFGTRSLADGWGITFNRPVTLLLQMIGVAILGLLAFNLFGPTPRFSFYYGSLLGVLFTAFIVFADAILGQEDPAS